ncbi:DMT family transporter [Aliishimia ponticola]|uniref:DMT family transporter n=1 Tax=Aliishimia ponticola TaxID=2499833 RepID=A0A4S4ND31_9RHOB|nr:DMT family transporter [Aliishimia ponticola]THH35941.1 DMT family transporter [Aliishimia ponticola]
MQSYAGLLALVFTAVSLVVVGDTFGKLLTTSGISPFFVAWSRFALAALVLLPMSGLRRAELTHLRAPRVLLRGALIAGGICCILTALRSEPIANVFGAFFIGPLVSFLLARILMGERPTPLRAALLGLGFVGVLLVVKPGFGVTPGMILALCAGVCYGGYLATTRLLAGAYRPRFLLISQLLIGTVLLAPLAASAGLPELTPRMWVWLAGSALGSAVGNYLLVIANRRAEATLIAPLVYTQLITATLMGIAVFGEWPDAVALSGLVLILASGLGALVAQRRVRV